MTDRDVATIDRCPFCGRERREWTENDGQGVIGSGGLAYCSHDCLARDQARG